jgi:hypothetical protein
MTFYPILPPRVDETLASFVGRLAKVHGNMELDAFLRFLGIPQRELIHETEAGVRRFAGLSGVPMKTLMGHAELPLKQMRFDFRGHNVGRDFLFRSKTTYCPACLLEDEKEGRGHRVERAVWRLSCAQRCSRHAIKLFEVPRKRKARAIGYITIDRIPSETLKVQAEGAPTVVVPQLQIYIEQRLAGAEGTAWLDQQGAGQVVELCERLGLLLVRGPHAQTRRVPEALWVEAVERGFEVLAGGEAAVRDALVTLIATHRERGQGGSAVAVFGSFYTWLGRQLSSAGPILDLVRDVVLEEFPSLRGDMVLGRCAETVPMCSVYDLSRQSKYTARALHHAAVAAGVFGDTYRPRPSAANLMTREQGAALLMDLDRSMTVQQVCDLLKVTARQFEVLTDAGLLAREQRARAASTYMQANMRDEDVFAVLSLFMGSATLVPEVSGGMQPLFDVANALPWPAEEVVKLAAGDLLSRKECSCAAGGLVGLHVDPKEVASILEDQARGGVVPLGQAVTALGCSRGDLLALLEKRDADGRPYFKATCEADRRGRYVWKIQEESVRAFKGTYVRLGALVQANGSSGRAMCRRLAKQGVQPAVSRTETRGLWYRRAEVRPLLTDVP